MINTEKLRFVYEDADEVLQAVADLKEFAKFPYGRDYDPKFAFYNCVRTDPLGTKHTIPSVFVRHAAGEHDHYHWAFNWSFLRAYNLANNFPRTAANYGVDDDMRGMIALSNGTENACYRSFDPDWTGNVRTVLEVVESLHQRMEYLRNCLGHPSKSVREQVNICVREVDRWLTDIDVETISRQLNDERLRMVIVLNGSACPPASRRDEVCFEAELTQREQSLQHERIKGLEVDRKQGVVRRTTVTRAIAEFETSSAEWYTFCLALDAYPDGVTDAKWADKYPAEWSRRRAVKNRVADDIRVLDLDFVDARKNGHKLQLVDNVSRKRQ